MSRWTVRAERLSAFAAAAIRALAEPSPVIAWRMVASRVCADVQLRSPTVRRRSSRSSSSGSDNEGTPRSSATLTSRSKPEFASRMRAWTPFKFSNRCARPSQRTHSPGRSSSRRAESGASLSVNLLRGWRHLLPIRYSLRQLILTCSVHHAPFFMSRGSQCVNNELAMDQMLRRETCIVAVRQNC
jgi:hypothetical protein